MARAADCIGSPKLIVDVDVNDDVWLRARKMTESSDVRTLVSQLKQNGCGTLLVRCGCLGILPYRTDLSHPVGFDAAHARANPAPGIVDDMEAFIKTRTAWDKRYAEVVRDFDPPAVFIREGHRQGMKVIAWIDIFDDFFPGYRSKFIEEHPHCQWVGKDGKTYFKGLLDYSWPRPAAFQVKQAAELLALGAGWHPLLHQRFTGICPIRTKSISMGIAIRSSRRFKRNTTSIYAPQNSSTKQRGTT